MLIKEHLDVFISIGPTMNSSWAGYSPHSLYTYLEKYSNISKLTSGNNLSKHSITRDDLFSQSKNQNYKGIDFALNVLAWGGIRRNHAITLANQWANCEWIINKLRSNTISRFDAYEAFFNLRQNNHLSGIGPAYFTKLIFFGGTMHDGYIMDQWTSRSINLLLGYELIQMIKMGNSSRVSDKNTAETYITFCNLIENIYRENKILISAAKVEESLFSNGGKNKGKWREYVLSNG
jgi:hypothetical protein